MLQLKMEDRAPSVAFRALQECSPRVTGRRLVHSLRLAGLGLALAIPATLISQTNSDAMVAVGTPIQAAPADPAIQKALSQVSAEQLRKNVEKLVSFHNRNTLSSMETDLPSGQGITAAADWIAAELQRYSDACGGCLEVKRDTFAQQPELPPQGRIPRPTTLTNVYAVLRGSDPAQAARMVLVTGHYDSRNSDVMNTRAAAPGANDDASGVAVSLECARVLSKLKFPSTIVFAAVAGEEQGLNGSRHLAQFAKEQGWQLGAVLNNDIVGGNTTPGDRRQVKSAIRVFSEGIPAPATPEEVRSIVGLGGESDSPSRELARAMADIAPSYFPRAGGLLAIPALNTQFAPILIFRRDRFLRGGDHTSFNQEGFAAIRLTEWREDFDHQHQDVRTENGIEYGDLLKFVDFDYVANVAKLNAATLGTLAAAPGPPRNVRIVTKDLDNESTLHWTAPAGAPPTTKYELIWRDTSAPDWQFSQAASPLSVSRDPADGRLGFAVNLSKDNRILAIRAVDAIGHRSVAVTPTPER